MKIHTHLALIATASVLPVLLVAAMTLVLVRHAQHQAVLVSLQDAARSTALQLDHELRDVTTGLRLLGNSAHLASGDIPGWYQQMTASPAHPDNWITVSDRAGRQLISTALSDSPTTTARATPAVWPDPDPARFGQAGVSNRLNDAGTHRNIVAVTLQLPTVQPRLTLAHVFETGFFQHMLPSALSGTSATVAILDRQGNVIARTPATETLVGTTARPDLLASSQDLTVTQWFPVSRDNTRMDVLRTRAMLSGWTVAIVVPATMPWSFAPVTALLLVLGVVAAILAAAVMTVLVGRRLRSAVQHAGLAAADLGHGPVARSCSTGVDELDQLDRTLAQAGHRWLLQNQAHQQAQTGHAGALERAHVARAQAEQENRAKDQFLALLGHELRNPLSAISGAIAVMKARETSAALSVRAHTIIERQSNRLNRVVSDLLDLSHLSLETIALDQQPVDLAAIVCASIDVLQATGRAGRCDIAADTEPAWIHADRPRIDQVIGQILANALKYSGMTGLIDVSVSRSMTHAVLSVRDFGKGITPEKMSTLYDPWPQGAVASAVLPGRLGIGLNLVRQIVERHAGSMRIASPGAHAGTTVEMRFPLAAGGAETALAPRPVAATVPAAAATVLLIEDNADSREMMAMLLGMLGFHVLEAATGREGVHLAQAQQPAIAVVDIGLPDMDGYTVARCLRAETLLQGMTLIALTGYGQEADRQQALAAGFDSHLVKPLDMDVLVSTIISHQARQRHD